VAYLLTCSGPALGILKTYAKQKGTFRLKLSKVKAIQIYKDRDIVTDRQTDTLTD